MPHGQGLGIAAHERCTAIQLMLHAAAIWEHTGAQAGRLLHIEIQEYGATQNSAALHGIFGRALAAGVRQ